MLASFDIVSLYTSISHNGGMQAVKKALANMEYTNNGKEFVLSLLWLVLTFIFNLSTLSIHSYMEPLFTKDKDRNTLLRCES